MPRRLFVLLALTLALVSLISTNSLAVPTAEDTLPPCVLTEAPQGPIDDVDLEGQPTCQVTTVSVGPPRTNPVGSSPGYKWVGLYTDKNYYAENWINGISARMTIGDPGVSHVPSCPPGSADFVAHRIMVGWVDPVPPGVGLSWIELGWIEEQATLEDKRTMYFAHYDAPTGQGDDRRAPGFNMTTGTAYPLLIKRDTNHPNFYKVQIYYRGEWHLLWAYYRAEAADWAEVFSETYYGCTNQEIAPGSTHHGNQVVTPDRQPIRLKSSLMSWWLWNSANFPSNAYGGPTRTRSTRTCIGSLTAVCETATFTSSWYDFTTS